VSCANSSVDPPVARLNKRRRRSMESHCNYLRIRADCCHWNSSSPACTCHTWRLWHFVCNCIALLSYHRIRLCGCRNSRHLKNHPARSRILEQWTPVNGGVGNPTHIRVLYIAYVIFRRSSVVALASFLPLLINWDIVANYFWWKIVMILWLLTFAHKRVCYIFRLIPVEERHTLFTVDACGVVKTPIANAPALVSGPHVHSLVEVTRSSMFIALTLCESKVKLKQFRCTSVTT